METTKELSRELETLTDLIADAIIRKTNPLQDDLSERQARDSYGALWLNRQVKLGLVKGHFIGNKKVYSRHQLDCLRAAERRSASILLKI